MFDSYADPERGRPGGAGPGPGRSGAGRVPAAANQKGRNGTVPTLPEQNLQQDCLPHCLQLQGQRHPLPGPPERRRLGQTRRKFPTVHRKSELNFWRYSKS